MTRPLVSVLVPAHDAEPWIAETLRSVLAQNWRPLEVVVVDDGSSDGTARVVEGFRAPEIRLLRQERRGQGAALNRALSAAGGAFIQFLDADDLLSPGKIAAQMGRIAGGRGLVATGAWGRFFGDPATAVFRPRPVWRDMAPLDWLVESFLGGEPMMQAGIFLLPAAVVRAAGPWDERLSLINDFEYFCRVLLSCGGVRFCGEARLYYRSGIRGSVSGTRSKEGWESALLSMRLGTGAVLAREDGPRVRRACADVFRTLEYQSYPDHPEVSRAAGERVEELGGSPLRPGGGIAFRGAASILGWRGARRLQRAAYRLGYGPVARWKGRRWRDAASRDGGA